MVYNNAYQTSLVGMVCKTFDVYMYMCIYDHSYIITYSSKASIAVENPTHVTMPETFYRAMNIFLCICILVVVTVTAHPIHGTSLQNQS